MYTFSVSCKNLFLKRDFSKTHKQTCYIHSWIARDLIWVGKLLRSKTNSRIASNLYFSELPVKIFDKPIQFEFPVPLYYS